MAIKGPLPEWTPTQRAWLVGVIEGEGFIGWDRRPELDVTMSDLDTIRRVADLLGVTVTVRDWHHRNVMRRDGTPALVLYRARAKGARAADILWRLLPDFGARRGTRAMDVLQRWYDKIHPEAPSPPSPSTDCPACATLLAGATDRGASSPLERITA